MIYYVWIAFLNAKDCFLYIQRFMFNKFFSEQTSHKVKLETIWDAVKLGWSIYSRLIDHPSTFDVLQVHGTIQYGLDLYLLAHE